MLWDHWSQGNRHKVLDQIVTEEVHVTYQNLLMRLSGIQGQKMQMFWCMISFSSIWLMLYLYQSNTTVHQFHTWLIYTACSMFRCDRSVHFCISAARRFVSFHQDTGADWTPTELLVPPATQTKRPAHTNARIFPNNTNLFPAKRLTSHRQCFTSLPGTVTVRSCRLPLSLSLNQVSSGCWSIIWLGCRDFRESRACAEVSHWPRSGGTRPITLYLSSLFDFDDAKYCLTNHVKVVSHYTFNKLPNEDACCP